MNSCPDCAAEIGERHDDGCDVARCLATGGQRLQCDPDEQDHGHNVDGFMWSCAPDVWTGEWPGEEDCRRLGFWCTDPQFPPMRPCAPDHPGAFPDLNRLVPECEWDPVMQRWELRK